MSQLENRIRYRDWNLENRDYYYCKGSGERGGVIEEKEEEREEEIIFYNSSETRENQTQIYLSIYIYINNTMENRRMKGTKNQGTVETQ